MIGTLIQAVIAAVVWIVANAVYLDMKRKGLGGFTRFAAFWAGLPTTLVTLLVVPEGRRPTFEAPAVEDDVALLQAIRRDRALRGEADEGAAGSPEGAP